MSPDELAEIPDAPSRREGGELTAEGPAGTSKLRAQDAAEAGAQAAAADAGGAAPENRGDAAEMGARASAHGGETDEMADPEPESKDPDEG